MENTKGRLKTPFRFFYGSSIFRRPFVFNAYSEETSSIALTSQSQPDRDRRSGRRVGGAGGR